MSNNNMRIVAHLLGVELEEEFKLKGQGRCSYKFTPKGLFCEYDDDGWFLTGITIFKLLNGEYEIEKLILDQKEKSILDQKEKSILDQKEKEYLSAVIKPFKNRVKGILKIGGVNYEWLEIYIDDDNSLVFPTFKKGTIYNGMLPNTEYTLKELGL